MPLAQIFGDVPRAELAKRLQHYITAVLVDAEFAAACSTGALQEWKGQLGTYKQAWALLDSLSDGGISPEAVAALYRALEAENGGHLLLSGELLRLVC